MGVGRGGGRVPGMCSPAHLRESSRCRETPCLKTWTSVKEDGLHIDTHVRALSHTH